ncbi:hypothetical protein Godav_024315 [Gossypium davidsonii]|uniref:TF-B3 domain-containing protein n=2 Tax=Gossypium TaxID=3633 RepID=A0A7J8SUN8_GOSDV|nr:hypothetical protein [Gossypium davidsonii]MBA0665499.1 hypothetical protein [Gossypium klotzschianum]
MTILFSKVLTNTDVEKRLAVPNNSLKHFELENGNCSKSVEVKDEKGSTWTFRCYVRSDGAYKKPVLSSGWRQFVVNKGVHRGDLITFCKDVEAEATYKIIVQRKIKLLGKEFWYSPEPEQPTDATAQVIQAPADATGEVIQSLAVLPDV